MGWLKDRLSKGRGAYASLNPVYRQMVDGAIGSLEAHTQHGFNRAAYERFREALSRLVIDAVQASRVALQEEIVYWQQEVAEVERECNNAIRRRCA